MLDRMGCQWCCSVPAFPGFLSSASSGVPWSHDHPRIIPLCRFKHNADALSHPLFVSLLAKTHLCICQQSNVRVLPWDFSRINIWILISSNRELLHWLVNAALLHCARSPANGKVPFEEPKQPGANTLAPKTRSQHSNKSGQISLVKLPCEGFSCGSPRVEMQHMLSISGMLWMQSGQKCKPRKHMAGFTGEATWSRLRQPPSTSTHLHLSKYFFKMTKLPNGQLSIPFPIKGCTQTPLHTEVCLS